MGEPCGVGGEAFLGARPQCCIWLPPDKAMAACRTKTKTHTYERNQKRNRMTGEKRENMCVTI